MIPHQVQQIIDNCCDPVRSNANRRVIEELCADQRFRDRQELSGAFNNLGDLIIYVQKHQTQIAIPQKTQGEDYQERSLDNGLVVRYKPKRDFHMRFTETEYQKRGFTECTLDEQTVMKNFPELRRFWWDNYFIWPNPSPIYDYHITLARDIHVVQSVSSVEMLHMFAFLNLAPQFRIFYNGPRLGGASVAKHQHFQGLVNELPIEREWGRIELYMGEASIAMVQDYPARAIEVKGKEPKAVADMTSRVLEVFMFPPEEIAEDVRREIVDVNILFARRGDYRTFIFPRTKELPIMAGTGEYKVRPGAVEMSGVMLTGDKGTYQKLTQGMTADILDEVSSQRNTVLACLKYII